MTIWNAATNPRIQITPILRRDQRAGGLRDELADALGQGAALGGLRAGGGELGGVAALHRIKEKLLLLGGDHTVLAGCAQEFGRRLAPGRDEETAFQIATQHVREKGVKTSGRAAAGQIECDQPVDFLSRPIFRRESKEVGTPTPPRPNQQAEQDEQSPATDKPWPTFRPRMRRRQFLDRRDVPQLTGVPFGLRGTDCHLDRLPRQRLPWAARFLNLHRLDLQLMRAGQERLQEKLLRPAGPILVEYGFGSGAFGENVPRLGTRPCLGQLDL